MKKLIITTMAITLMAYAGLSRDANGIVTDTNTGLQWQDDYNGSNVKYTDWNGSINYCEQLSLGGKTDWRLPNYNELFSIVDLVARQPKIDTNIFTYPLYHPSSGIIYFTSTTYKTDNPDYNLNQNTGVWVISFNNDALYPFSDIKTAFNLVRCVRDITNPLNNP